MTNKSNICKHQGRGSTIGISTYRLSSHAFATYIDKRATKTSWGSINEPRFYDSLSKNEPHFLHKCFISLLTITIAAPPPKKPNLHSSASTRTMKHKKGFPITEERATFLFGHSINQPYILDARATHFYPLLEQRATKSRLASHKNLCKWCNCLRNSAANIKTLCLYKNNKTIPVVAFFLENQ